MEIHELIALDNIPQATKRLLDFVRDFSEENEQLNEAIIICNNCNRLLKQERRMVLSFEQIELQRNRILFQILNFLDDVHNGIVDELISEN